MTAYVIAGVRLTGDASELAAYRSAVTATLEPYNGRYLVRTTAVEVLEGDWPAESLAVVEFPDRESARAWDASAAYRRIAPIRSRNSESIRLIVEGV